MARFSQVLTVLQGTVLAQAIGLAALPIISRQFDPEAFGVLQLYQSFIVIALVIANLRYEVATLNAEQERQALAVFHLCLCLTACVAALSAVIVFVLWLLGWPALPKEAVAIAVILPLAILAGGTFQVMGYLPIRKKDFRASARSKISQGLGYAGSAIAIGAIWPAAFGLVIADLLGRIMGSAYLSRWCARVFPQWLDFRPEVMRTAAMAHRELPFFAVPGALMSATSAFLTPLFLFALFDAAVAGQFGLVERSLTLAFSVLATSVAQVVTGTFSELVRTRDPSARAEFDRIVLVMAAVSIAPCLALFALGPDLFVLVFGPEWRMAGEIAQIMSVLYLGLMVTVPVNMVIVLMGKQRHQLAWDAGKLALFLLAWLWASNAGLAPLDAIKLHVMINLVSYLAFLLLARTLLSRHAAAAQSQ